MTPESSPEFKPTRNHAILALAMAVGIVACTSLVTQTEWDKEAHGPVVPHDTFPADCSLCHVSGNWHTIKKDFVFDHEKETGVPLNGAHAKASCLMCHNDRGNVETFAAKGCAGCHEDIHRGAMGKNCDDCHTEQTWRPEDSIAKHNRTRFPLVGAHAATACFTCHEGAQVGNFEGLDISCESCHTSDLVRATSPDHAALGLTNDCQRCHTPTTWNSARFDHPSSFPLIGGHGGLDCASCHTTVPYEPLPTDCASCHLDNYQQTTEPNHVGAGFGMSCEQCHTINSWQSAQFNHPWPLTGAHATVNCSQCHEGGVYTGLETDCASCHLTDFQQTTDPNHVTSGFGTNCATCHNTNSWEGATFDHPWPLTGTHATTSCSACHGGGVFTGLETDCASCHLTDFQQTTDPNHVTSGFGTNCATCHGTNSWEGATFDHPFPIAGAHRNLSCADCHLVPSAPSEFSCTHCHAHTQQESTNEHQDVSDFIWSSPACYQCHPNGRGRKPPRRRYDGRRAPSPNR